MLLLLAALAPILVVLVLLLLRVQSLFAAVAGFIVAIVVAFLEFPLGGDEIWSAVTSTGSTVIEVALILLGGVGLAECLRVGGAQDKIASWLKAAERKEDRTVSLLLLVFGLTPFMESVTGFGIGVVITAPLLMRLGLTPVKAVVSGLLGLVLVPWGSLGPGTLVAAELSGVNFHDLGVWSALLTLPVLILSMTVVIAINLGRPRLRQVALAAAVILTEWLALLGASVLLGPPLAGVLASGAVIMLLLSVIRCINGKLPAVNSELGRALLPFAVLLVGLLLTMSLTTLISPLQQISWIASPALWLIISALVAVKIMGSLNDPRHTVTQIVRAWVTVAANTVMFILLGIVMATTGMAAFLAENAANSGQWFAGAIPAIGAFGGYLTGSNTGAAAMFSAATAAAAGHLGVEPLLAVAGQNVAGSLAIIASPPRVALACSVVLPRGQRLPPRATGILLTAVISAAVLLGFLLLLLR